MSEFGRNPFVDKRINIQWPWQPEVLVMKVGPSLVVGSGSPLRLRGKRVMGFRPELVKNLGMNAIIFDSEVVDVTGVTWLKIEDGWFNLDIKRTADLIFAPQTKSFSASHYDNTTYINLTFKKYLVEEFKKYLQTFMTNQDAARKFVETIDHRGVIDSDGNIPIMSIDCCLRTPEVEILIKGHKMTFQSFLPGLQETFDWHSHIVDEYHNINLTDRYGNPFFSLG